MDKELINRAWASLPAEFRKEVRERYNILSTQASAPTRDPRDICEAKDARSQKLALENIFGLHNLTSDAEPEEVLCIPKYVVVDAYKKATQYIANAIKNQDITGEIYGRGQKYILKGLFGFKCLPDTAPEQPKPKFKVGDKVQDADKCSFDYDVYEVVKVYTNNNGEVRYDIQGLIGRIGLEESDIKPYRKESALEPYTVPTDKAEEKELDLYQLLKGHEGKEVFSVTDGVIKITKVTSDEIQLYAHDTTIIVGGNMMYRSGICVIYPTKELYEQYPLDAAKAWAVWTDSQKPKRWRAEKNGEYWSLLCDLQVSEYFDSRSDYDNAIYECGNYFKHPEDAEYAASELRKTLLRVQEELNKTK